MRKTIIAVLGLLMLMSCIVEEKEYTEYRRSFEERHQVTPGYNLSITGRDGDIRIVGWDRSELEITGEMSVWVDSEETAEKEFEKRKIVKDGDAVFLSYDPSRDREKMIYKKIDYQIMTPKYTHVELDIDDGHIEIDGLEGSISITGDDISGTITGGTDLTLKSDDGNVKLVDVKGEIFIESDDTDVFLKAIDSPRITIRTDEGSVEGEFSIIRDGEYRITTDDGDIILRLPEETASTVVIEKDDGDFEIDFPFLLKKTTGANLIEGIINEDAALIVITTDDGDIRITVMDR